MKDRQKGTVVLGLALTLSILLIIVSAGPLVNEFNHYGEVVAQNPDAYLLNSVRYIDRNLSLQLDTYQSELQYVINRRGFLLAEQNWLQDNETAEMLSRMRENLLAEDAHVDCVLAIVEGQIRLSTSGRTDYTLPDDYSAASVTTVTDGNGTVYLALPCTRNSVTYMALINLADYYAYMKQALPVETDRLYMLNAADDYFIYQQDGAVCVTATGKLSSDHPDAPVLAAMLACVDSSKPATASISSVSPSGERYTARLAIVDEKDLLNEQVSIAMSVNYDTIIAPLYDAMQDMLFYAVFAMLGVAMLVVVALLITMRNARGSRELRELQQKSEEMSKLTEKTLSLYHHQRLETIGTLTSSIAHEFGNLLTPIMGYSTMTMEALPPECEDLADNLQEIYNASRSAKDIISRLSDLSRKNTGASYRYLAPDELVRRTLSVAQPARPGSVKLETELNAAGCWLHGNETQLSQMLLNLILNACHAMKESGGVLSVSTSVENKLLRIRVHDTGKGIPPENLGKIFDPFFTTREAGKGTGLGLPIALQVAHTHGGDISVSSCVDEGSVFNVILPLSDPPPAEEEMVS